MKFQANLRQKIFNANKTFKRKTFSMKYDILIFFPLLGSNNLFSLIFPFFGLKLHLFLTLFSKFQLIL